MADQRQTTIYMDAVQMTAMRNATDAKEWMLAVGYLSTWNLTFPSCAIYPDGETDMVAVYYNEAGERTYVIGAVWHGEHYGFHS